MKRTVISSTTNKAKDGMTQGKLLKIQAKQKKKKKSPTDMYGNKIIVHEPSAFEKK